MIIAMKRKKMTMLTMLIEGSAALWKGDCVVCEKNSDDWTYVVYCNVYCDVYCDVYRDDEEKEDDNADDVYWGVCCAMKGGCVVCEKNSDDCIPCPKSWVNRRIPTNIKIPYNDNCWRSYYRFVYKIMEWNSMFCRETSGYFFVCPVARAEQIDGYQQIERYHLG